MYALQASKSHLTSKRKSTHAAIACLGDFVLGLQAAGRETHNERLDQKMLLESLPEYIATAYFV
jgi:hypothetical protein